MLASELVTKAWYFSGIVAREANTPNDTQSADGLSNLNSILASFGASGSGIPYTSHTTLNLTPSQQINDIEGLVRLDVLTFNLGHVRFTMKRDTQNNYFNVGRPENIDALPYEYYSERIKGGTRIYLYFFPMPGLILNMAGMYSLPSNLTPGSDLDVYFDRFYQDYLMFKLAERLCGFYDQPFPIKQQQELERYERAIKSMSPIDLSARTTNLFATNNPNAFYAQANFGQGWTP